MQLQVSAGSPQWNDGGEQRLLISMLVATLLVAALLSVARLPVIPEYAPLVEFIVRIVREPADDVRIPAQAEPVLEEHLSVEDTPGEPSPVVGDETTSTAEVASRDTVWSVDIAATSEAAIDAHLDRLESPYSVNPLVAAKRRAFEGSYQPRTRARPRPIWENVEEDQLGRKVLRSGNCYRVIDDPNVGSQYAFREFGQYIVTCTAHDPAPRDLPWVAEIRERHSHLKYRDAYVAEESVAE